MILLACPRRNKQVTRKLIRTYWEMVSQSLGRVTVRAAKHSPRFDEPPRQPPTVS